MGSSLGLVSLYNHLCHFQSENIFANTSNRVTLRSRLSFDIQDMISLKNRPFEKNATKSMSAGTQTEPRLSAV